MGDNLDKKYSVVPKDAIIDLKIKGDYYVDLKSVFNNYLLEDEDKESIGVILDNLSQNKVSTPKEHRLYVMYVMLLGIEYAIKEQGLSVEKTMEEIKTPQD